MFLKKLCSPYIVPIEIVLHNVIDNWKTFIPYQWIVLHQKWYECIKTDFIKLEEVAIIL